MFCDKVLLQPALASDTRFATNSLRVASREALPAVIVQAFADVTAEAVIARLDAAQIANAIVNDMLGLWLHPQLAARGRWARVVTPADTVPALLPSQAHR